MQGAVRKDGIRIILGIDPGAKGGIAVYRHSSLGEAYEAWPLPETDQEIRNLLLEIVASKGGDLHMKAFLENVHAMPRGSIANFKLGSSYGALKMLLTCFFIPFEEVAPAKWQKLMGCLSGGKKAVTRNKAQCMFPMVEKITNRTADALLICEYGRRQLSMAGD